MMVGGGSERTRESERVISTENPSAATTLATNRPTLRRPPRHSTLTMVYRLWYIYLYTYCVHNNIVFRPKPEPVKHFPPPPPPPPLPRRSRTDIFISTLVSPPPTPAPPSRNRWTHFQSRTEEPQRMGFPRKLISLGVCVRVWVYIYMYIHIYWYVHTTLLYIVPVQLSWSE